MCNYNKILEHIWYIVPTEKNSTTWGGRTIPVSTPLPTLSEMSDVDSAISPSYGSRKRKDLPYVVIFEDDVQFTSDEYPKKLQQVLDSGLE